MNGKLVIEVENMREKYFLRKWQSLIWNIINLSYQWDIQTSQEQVLGSLFPEPTPVPSAQ